MHRGLSATDRGGIHDVVVHQGEVVEELDAKRFVERVLLAAAEQLAAQEGERGPHTLRGQAHEIRHGHIQRIIGQGGDPPLHVRIDQRAVPFHHFARSFIRYSPYPLFNKGCARAVSCSALMKPFLNATSSMHPMRRPWRSSIT